MQRHASLAILALAALGVACFFSCVVAEKTALAQNISSPKTKVVSAEIGKKNEKGDAGKLQGEVLRSSDLAKSTGSTAISTKEPPGESTRKVEGMAPEQPSDTSSLATATSMDASTYTVRLRDLESRIDELKSQIRTSHTRLSLLSDAVTSTSNGVRAEIIFKNKMSGAYRMVKLLVVMDGVVQYNKADETGALAEQEEIPIFSGSVPGGEHSVQVVVGWQGYGFGVLTYTKGYHFESKSSHVFSAVDGKQIMLTATAFEKGGVAVPFEQRPGMDWAEKIETKAPSEIKDSSSPKSKPNRGGPK